MKDFGGSIIWYSGQQSEQIGADVKRWPEIRTDEWAIESDAYNADEKVVIIHVGSNDLREPVDYMTG